MSDNDEETGLPPLDQPTEEDTLWVMQFTSGQADALSPIDGSPRGCLVVSFRGLHQGAWGQIHVAVPHGAVSQLREHVDFYLRNYPEEGDHG